MRYLCARHQSAIAARYQAAESLWRLAMDRGAEARSAGQWALARSYFGSAYEIAVIRMRIPPTPLGDAFTLRQLAEAGRSLVDMLYLLDEYDEAESCLLLIHHTLIEATGDERREARERQQGLSLVGEFLDRVVALLNQRGKISHANSVTLVSWEVCKTYRASVLH